MPSIFTRIIEREIPAYIIAESEDYIAFLDVFPLAEGHVLVVPKRETDYLFDLEDAALSGIMLFAKQVAHALKKAIPCKRIGIAVIGLEVPHAHIHLVPLQRMDDINFSRSKLKLAPGRMEEIADCIKAELQ